MSKKKTVCLQENIVKIAEQKARMVSGGNFSSYISMLIYKDNEQEIVKEIQEQEARKPERISEFIKAKYNSECFFCRETIHVGDEICSAVFKDGSEHFVHKRCTKD